MWSHTTRSGIKSIKLDHCKFASTDLAVVMQAMSKNLIATEISAEHCDLHLKKPEDWEPILEAV